MRVKQPSMAIKTVTKEQFDTLTESAFCGQLRVCREIAWFVSRDEMRAGTVILDLVDRDFSWVMLLRGSDGSYACEDLGVSLPSAETAEDELCNRLSRASVGGQPPQPANRSI